MMYCKVEKMIETMDKVVKDSASCYSGFIKVYGFG